jgi:uncharacterized protein YegL
MTDGQLHDDVTAVGKKIRQREAEEKLHALCFGVPGYRADQLKRLSDRVFELVNYQFSDFFSWIGQSMATISEGALPPGTDKTLPTTSTIVQISS